MKIGLVIPVLNNFDQALDLVFSAKTRDHELKIYIRPQYRYQVPLAAAWNQGFSEAVQDGCDYIIISNDDVLLAPWTIDAWVESATQLPDNIVLSAPLDVTSTFFDPFEIVFSDPTTEYEYQERELFSCFMVKSNFFELCGSFDENFDPAWHEDNDMHVRIRLLGYNVKKFQIPYIHLGSQTTKKMLLPINSLKGQQYYVRKWGSYTRNAETGESFRTPYNDPNLTPRDWILGNWADFDVYLEVKGFSRD